MARSLDDAASKGVAGVSGFGYTPSEVYMSAK